MNYEFLNLKDGDVLTSEHINHLENGILELSSKAKYMKETMVNILGDKDIPASTDEELSEILRKFTYLRNPSMQEYEYSADLIDIKSDIESGTIRMVLTDQNAVKFKVMATNGFVIDWGDGKTNTYNSTSLTVATHTYTKGSGQYYNGTYTQFMATIYPSHDGSIIQYQANTANGSADSGHNPILAFVSKDVYFQNINGMFSQHTNLKSIDIIGGSLGINELNTQMGAFAHTCSNLKYINANVCWSSITSLKTAFMNCSVLEYLNLGEYWNTINCTSFESAFYGCSLLKQIPSLITSSATTLTSMCQECNSLEIINGDIWDLTNCITMTLTFKNCYALTTLPYLVNTNNVTSGGDCFYGCQSLKKFNNKQLSLDFSSLNSATNLFYGCTSLEELPELNLEKATSVRYLCYNCNNLYITQSYFYLPSVKGASQANTNPDAGHYSMEMMFGNCTSLTNAPEFYAPNAVVIAGLFYNCINLVNVPEAYSFPSCLNAKQMFYQCTLLQTAPRIIDLPKAQYVNQLFYKCTSLRIAPANVEGDSFEFPEAINASNMFSECTSLQTAPIELKLPKATSISSMFNNCTSLVTAPKIVEFGAATNIESFFKYCTSLQYPPNRISAPLATKATSLFENCTNLIVCPELDLPVCTAFSSCFRYCNALTSTIPYHFPKATNLDYFYYQCMSLSFIEAISTDAASMKITAFAHECKNLETIAVPFSTKGNITWEGGSAQVPFDSNSHSTALRKITNSMDVYSGSMNYITNILGSQYLEGTLTLSGLKNALTINNKPYLTGFRLENVQTGMANLTITNCALDADAINQLFEDLPKVTTTRTINIKGNPGAETCNQSIATAKNWTVVYI